MTPRDRRPDTEASEPAIGTPDWFRRFDTETLASFSEVLDSILHEERGLPCAECHYAKHASGDEGVGREALLIEHRCTKIADFQPYMDLARGVDGRERHLWIGKLDEPIEGAKHETHCVHLKAGMKPPMVFGINAGDMELAAAVCLAVLGYHVNLHWLEVTAAHGYHAAGGEPPEWQNRPNAGPIEGPVRPAPDLRSDVLPALALFKSMVLSGEDWTETAQRTFDRAVEAVRATGTAAEDEQ